MVHKPQAYRHYRRCHFNINRSHVDTDKDITQQSRLFLSRMTASYYKVSEDFDKLLAKVRDDPIGEYIKTDPILRQLGDTLVVHKGFKNERYIRDRLRKLSKFFLHFKEMNDTSVTPVGSLQEIFTSKNFNKCLNVTQTM